MADIIRRCKDCGKVLPEGTSSRRLYCDACRKLRQRENDRAWHQKHSAREAKKPPVVRYCTACGEALPLDSAANRKYCLACVEKIRLDDARDRHRRVREAKLKVEKPAPEEKLPLGRHRKVDKPCKECGTMMYGVDPGKMFCDACKKAQIREVQRGHRHAARHCKTQGKAQNQPRSARGR